MNKEEILKAMKELPKVETNIPISAMNSINFDDLMSAIDRLDKTPTYQDLLKENKQLKEQVDRLIKKEYEKDNNYIVKVRTGEQLEREQYLLNFKSKSMLASMLIDKEERIDKAIGLLELAKKSGLISIRTILQTLKEDKEK